jgi:thiol-disulfide isomerase/thioredoxin
MTRTRFVPAAAAILAAWTSASLAQADSTRPQAQSPAPSGPAAPPSITLHVGDRAPALSIERWVKGEPLTAFEKGRVYVVDFWTTWSGPCITSMPHLSALQKEYKDRVRIVAVTREDPTNTLDKVQAMVKEKGDGMGYTVSWDRGNETYDAYMKASGRGQLPCSFVVDGTGTLAYIGHPLWLDVPLARIAKGTWDYTRGMEEVAAAQTRLQSIGALAANDPKTGLSELRALEADYPAIGDAMFTLKFSLLVREGSAESRLESRQMVTNAVSRRDPQRLVSMAIALTAANVEKPDLDLAMTAASKSVEFSEGKNPLMLETLAKVHFLKGDKAAAIEWQKKAIAAAPESRKPALEKVLADYERESK